jgi:ankyrin repeat protein
MDGTEGDFRLIKNYRLRFANEPRRSFLIAAMVLLMFSVGCRAKHETKESSPAAAPIAADNDLLDAAGKGDTAQVESLLDKGANVNGQSNTGVSALMLAAGVGNEEMLRALLNKGADVNLKSPGGYTALMAAALNGHPHIVKVLIERGANVNAQDIGKQTALKMAQSKGNTEIVSLLKKAGAKE